MPLLNYTTTVSADKSITAIQHEYDQNGNIMALSFRIKLDDKDISFRPPTDWRAVQKRLEAQRVEPRYQLIENAIGKPIVRAVVEAETMQDNAQQVQDYQEEELEAVV